MAPSPMWPCSLPGFPAKLLPPRCHPNHDQSALTRVPEGKAQWLMGWLLETKWNLRSGSVLVWFLILVNDVFWRTCGGLDDDSPFQWVVFGSMIPWCFLGSIVSIYLVFNRHSRTVVFYRCFGWERCTPAAPYDDFSDETPKNPEATNITIGKGIYNS